jgi:hypothetical protein
VSHQCNNPKAEITDALDRITQAVSIRMFKNDIAGRLSKDFKWSDVTTLVDFDESVLKETCHLSISKMRRRQRMKVRFITSDGSFSELRLRRLIFGRSGPRTDIKLDITIAAEPKIQKKIIKYQFVRLGQAITLEFQRFQWEIPTDGDVERMWSEEEKQIRERPEVQRGLTFQEYVELQRVN